MSSPHKQMFFLRFFHHWNATKAINLAGALKVAAEAWLKKHCIKREHFFQLSNMAFESLSTSPRIVCVKEKLWFSSRHPVEKKHCAWQSWTLRTPFYLFLNKRPCMWKFHLGSLHCQRMDQTHGCWRGASQDKGMLLFVGTTSLPTYAVNVCQSHFCSQKVPKSHPKRLWKSCCCGCSTHTRVEGVWKIWVQDWRLSSEVLFHKVQVAVSVK